MAGGLLQLIVKGAQDLYISGSPQISFFKAVYRRYTNFSLEAKRLEFNKDGLYRNQTQTLICEIKRYGDLLSDIYLVFTLPAIYDDTYEFKWIKNIGEAIINNCYIYMGGTIVDRHYGEFVHIWNQLSMSGDKKEIYNKCIGNIPELTDPASLYSGTYPSVIKSTSSNPSIPSRTIYVPLNFWFNGKYGLALPLIAMQHYALQIYVELKSLSSLYVLKDPDTGEYFAPDSSIAAYNISNFIIDSSGTADVLLPLEFNLLANYVFLDNLERKYFTETNLDYLIEQNTQLQYNGISSANNTLNLNLQNPIKELIWVIKRNNISDNNDWFNFTDDNYSDNNILISAKIMFNGLDRIDQIGASYFNLIQPLQHHTNTKDGIYVYSFSIHPENFQPSGCVNASRITHLQLVLEMKNPLTSDYQYDVTVYTVNYNIFKNYGGMPSIVFSS